MPIIGTHQPLPYSVLPQADLRLKQGIVLLIRTCEIRGVMAILNDGLHAQGQIVSALPPARRTSSLKEVEPFFTSGEV